MFRLDCRTLHLHILTTYIVWGEDRFDARKLGTPGNAARDRIDAAEPRSEPHQ
jgi:hypothetical protein